MNGNEVLSWSEYAKLLVALLTLADPIGNLPIVFALTKNNSRQEKEKIFRSSAITFILTLFIFTFIGVQILNLFGISVTAFKVAGGILFLFYGLEMLEVIQLPHASGGGKERSKPIGIVPLGIPILAGPGTITKVVIYSGLHSSFAHRIAIMGAIVTIGVLNYFIFRMSLIFGEGLDKIFMTIIVKVMGLILAGIAIEFILEGILEFLP